MLPCFEWVSGVMVMEFLLMALSSSIGINWTRFFVGMDGAFWYAGR
jgi:hypothetical protein